jgi:hypothetical protein
MLRGDDEGDRARVLSVSYQRPKWLTLRLCLPRGAIDGSLARALGIRAACWCGGSIGRWNAYSGLASMRILSAAISTRTGRTEFKAVRRLWKRLTPLLRPDANTIQISRPDGA